MKVRNTGSPAPVAGASAVQAENAYRKADAAAVRPATAPEDVATATTALESAETT